MATSITIRAVPDDVRDELARRAAVAGQTLQKYLNAELRSLAERPSAADALWRARQRVRAYPSITTEEIRIDLEADRR